MKRDSRLSSGYYKSEEFQKDIVDRIAGRHDVAADLHSSVQASCLGMGSVSYPLATEHLEAFQDAIQMKSVRAMRP